MQSVNVSECFNADRAICSCAGLNDWTRDHFSSAQACGVEREHNGNICTLKLWNPSNVWAETMQSFNKWLLETWSDVWLSSELSDDATEQALEEMMEKVSLYHSRNILMSRSAILQLFIVLLIFRISFNYYVFCSFLFLLIFMHFCYFYSLFKKYFALNDFLFQVFFIKFQVFFISS